MREAESMRRKVAGMFMCGFTDTRPDGHILSLVRDYGIGGVVYFRRNIATAEQVRTCSAELQRAAEQPLLIAVDQEGGMVLRIEDGVTAMPGNMALGAVRDPEAVRQAAAIAGAELRQLGINMNFAPCVDVNNNPANPVIGVRSYGESPELVSELGAAAAAGYREAGVAPTLKHFPGHGDTDTDSHLALPVIGHDRERLEKVELAPFRHIIGAGTDAVMTAHVVFPAYEQRDIPATLSRPIVTGLLREQLGFGGVIVTDCLEMNAISETVGVGAGAVQAVQAGADLILVCHRMDRQVEAIEAVTAAVLAGEIDESRIDESLDRLRRLKAERGIARAGSLASAGLVESGSGGGPAEGEAGVATAESLAFARRLSERSITLVKDEGLLPLRADIPTYVIWPEVRADHEVVEALKEKLSLGKALKPYLSSVTERVIGVDPTEEEIGLVLAESAGYGQIVAVTYNAGFSEGQRRILSELHDRIGAAVVVVAARDPFDYTAVPGIRTYLASYENKPSAMLAAAKALTGRLIPQGRLPVTVGEFGCGTGSSVES